MYHLWRNEMYRLGDNAPKSYVVHRRLTFIVTCITNDKGGQQIRKMGKKDSYSIGYSLFDSLIFISCIYSD